MSTSSEAVIEDESSESCDNLDNENKLESRTSKCSEDIKNLSSSNTNVENSPKTSNLLINENDTSEGKLAENNVSNSSSQLNQTECNYLINVLSTHNADLNQHLNSDNLNTQDEQLILEIIKKNKKHIFPSNTQDIDEMNTQEFMNLNLHRATAKLQKSHSNEDVSESTIKHIDSDDSVVITRPSMTKTDPVTENLNLKENNKNVITVKKSEKCNTLSSIACEQYNSDQDSEKLNPDQDSEFITFKAMCEALSTIRSVDDDMEYNSNSVIFKQVNADVISCLNPHACKPSTSKLSSVDPSCLKDKDISNHSVLRKRTSSMLDSSEEDISPEYLSKSLVSPIVVPSKSKSSFQDKNISKNSVRRKLNSLKSDSSGGSSLEYLNDLATSSIIPSKNKSNSFVSSNRLQNKSISKDSISRKRTNSKLDSSGESSSEDSNKLPQKQFKKLIPRQKSLKTNSECHLDNVLNGGNDVKKKLGMITEASVEDKDYMPIKSKSSFQDKNISKNSVRRKFDSFKVDSSEEENSPEYLRKLFVSQIIPSKSKSSFQDKNSVRRKLNSLKSDSSGGSSPEYLIDTNSIIPSKNKLNSVVSSNRLKNKNISKDSISRKRTNSESDSSGESSSENSNKLPQKQFKKLIPRQKSLKTNSECHLDNVLNGVNDVKKRLSTINEASFEDKDYMPIKKNMPIITSTLNRNCKRKKSISPEHDMESFHCSPNGVIHQDMLDYIRRNFT